MQISGSSTLPSLESGLAVWACFGLVSNLEVILRYFKFENDCLELLPVFNLLRLLTLQLVF